MFSIITLVNSQKAYNRNVVEAAPAGCQLVPVVNAPSAAVGLNEGIRQASGDVLILCHQDVVFPECWLDDLSGQIEKISDDWGVLGTFGVDTNGNLAGNIKDPHNNPKLGDLPCEAMSLDEHCLIIQKSSGLRFDESLTGWHMYGADICLKANNAGLKNYVIDARLTHLSGGRIDNSYKKCAEEFKRKWKNRSPYDFLTTTCSRIHLNELPTS